MRYSHGIIFGAIIPGIIFLGAAVIKIAGIGADAAIIEALWNVYVVWFLISIIFPISFLIMIRFARKDLFTEVLIFMAGGFFFFSPLWLFFATEISGDSWTDLLLKGITSGLIGFGPSSTIVGIGISNVFLVPFLILSVILGVVFLNPSFVAKHTGPVELPELTALKETAVGLEEDSIEAEMPDVTPPTTTADSVAALREVLIELGTTDPVINLILNSGIGTITDLAATGHDQLSNLSGLDRHAAENLLISVQKRLWFSDI